MGVPTGGIASLNPRLMAVTPTGVVFLPASITGGIAPLNPRLIAVTPAGVGASPAGVGASPAGVNSSQHILRIDVDHQLNALGQPDRWQDCPQHLVQERGAGRLKLEVEA